jgi:hypothetical protein
MSTFVRWCRRCGVLNRISKDTGRRLVADRLVEVVQLSAHRIGITVGANRRFHERQTRKDAGGPS